MKLLAMALLGGAALADSIYQKPVGSGPSALSTDDKRPWGRQGDADDFPEWRPDSYNEHGAIGPEVPDMHYNDERYYPRYGELANDRYHTEPVTAHVADMTVEYEVELGWRWNCTDNRYFKESINVRVPATDGSGNMVNAEYCNFDFDGCRRVCEEFDQCAGFDIREGGDASSCDTPATGEKTICILKTDDDVWHGMLTETTGVEKTATGGGENRPGWAIACQRFRGQPHKECPEDMVLVPFYKSRINDTVLNGDDSGEDEIDGRIVYDIDIDNASDGNLCIDWTSPVDFEEYAALIGYSNRMHHLEPKDEETNEPIRTPWGVIDTRVRKTQNNWPLEGEKLKTWRRTFGQGGRTCRDGNDFTDSDCMASQYAAAVVCERRGLTLCTTEQYQALMDFQKIFKRELSFTENARFETSSDRDDDGPCVAESFDKVLNDASSRGCKVQKNAETMFAYKCCEEFRHKHVQVDGYVLQHDHIVSIRFNSTDIMKHDHFDAIEVDSYNGKPMERGSYWIEEKRFRPHTHYAMDGTRFSHRHYTSYGDGHQHDRRWDILYGHDGRGHAQGHSYNGHEGVQSAGHDYNLGYDARQGYARGAYGDGHVHSDAHGHAHDGHDPDGQDYGPGFRTSHSHSQYDIHGFGHASDLAWEDNAHEVHYVAQ